VIASEILTALIPSIEPMPNKPKLGQNFLIDPSACQRIVEALGDLSGQTVLEIGPGKGAITKLLAARAHRLVAVELDPALARQLRQTSEANEQVEVLEQDILATDLSAIAASIAPGEKLAVVGNLPYYITSQILLHLFDHYRAVDRALVMVQREVADRVAAQPGSRDYGLLTATTQLYARVENLFTLPPSAFAPPPEVYSTVLRLDFAPQFERLGVVPAEFGVFLRQAFAQKRKTLANNLRFAGHAAEAVASAFAEARIPADIRAEALPLEDAAKLFLALQPAGRGEAAP
jgi:16S rRNA (adenine1518-N6/adenine1519-N6)-dimethyltransferase